MKKIKVSLKNRSYDILIGEGILKDCGPILRRLDIGKDAIVITNSGLLGLCKRTAVKALKRSGLSVRFETVPASEKAKSSAVAIRLIDKISAYDKNKRIFIVAFGGGVVGDLAGFVAATYKRGIPYIQLPTTLLAQVDSAIGGKTAIDTPVAKNMVGAFYQPKIVISDISLIRSLSARQIRNGLAEIIKYGVIKDKRLFEYLEKNYGKIFALEGNALEFVISRSSAIKAKVVEKDEFDNKGLRAILNYGHTIGHAIEAAACYSKRYGHGEAIAIGMVAAARISSLLGLIGARESLRIEALIRKVGLPAKIKNLRFSDIYEAHLHDKKFIRGKNRLILPVAIGKVRVVEDVPGAIIAKALKERF